MNGVELSPVSKEVFNGVSLNEGEWVFRLRVKIDAGHIETRPHVSGRTSPGPTI